MPQLEIDKWAQGKPVFLTIFSQQLASFAGYLHEILSYVKNQEHIPKLPEAAPKEWLQLYRNHRLLEKRLTHAIKQFGGFAEVIVTCYLALRSPKKLATSPNQESQENLAAALQQIYQLNLADIESDVKNRPLDDETIRKAKDLFVTQEVLFLCKVVLPCLLFYGMAPCKLIRRARLGNLEALERLIRLDKLTLADPGIIRQTQRLLHHNKYKYDSVVAKAIKDAPKFTLSHKSATYLLAGLISLLSEVFGHKLEEPEIRALFDAVAHDRSDGETVVDSALPDSPETFSKAIQRERAFWKPIFFPDKTL